MSVRLGGVVVIIIGSMIVNGIIFVEVIVTIVAATGVIVTEVGVVVFLSVVIGGIHQSSVSRLLA